MIKFAIRSTLLFRCEREYQRERFRHHRKLFQFVKWLGLSSLLLPFPLVAGDIVGSVTTEIPHESGRFDSEGGNYGSRRYKFLQRVDYDRMSGFVVHIDKVEVPVDADPPTASVEQIDGTFIPHVLPIQAGTKVLWPNRDAIFHNVFSMSEAKPFDLGYYKDTDDPKAVIFDQPGRVDVFCSIHTQMNCVVLVLPNPWFTKTNAGERFEIRDVPAGTYQLRTWHERMPPKTVQVTVPEQGEVEVEIEMGISGLPKIE